MVGSKRPRGRKQIVYEERKKAFVLVLTKKINQSPIPPINLIETFTLAFVGIKK